MVRLVQLVEHQIVVLGVVGSSPTSHPKERMADKSSSVFSLLDEVEEDIQSDEYQDAATGYFGRFA